MKTFRGGNKEKLVDRSLILNHEVKYPRAAGDFGGAVTISDIALKPT